MKEKENIDELLNSFIDDELTERQQTEVQRLVAHNKQVARRLKELQKCKVLLGSLPFEEAPVGMLDDIKTSLERRTLLSEMPEHFDRRIGARHLLLRKIVSAAAMIALVAVLAGVIYSIVGIETVTEEPIIASGQKPAMLDVKVEKPRPSLVAVADKSIPQITPVEFNCRLELSTNNLFAADAVLSRAIEDNGILAYNIPAKQTDKRIYAVSCSRQNLASLLADLKTVWGRFNSAAFLIETEQEGEYITVDAVATEQIAKIVNQDSLEATIQMAKDFAVLNRLEGLLPHSELALLEDESTTPIAIPKPRLTSSQKTIKKKHTQIEDEKNVHLTIVVTGN